MPALGVGERKETLLLFDAALAAETTGVAVQVHVVITGAHGHGMVHPGLGGMKVEDIDHGSPFKGEPFFYARNPQEPDGGLAKKTAILNKGRHGPVKACQKWVFQVRVVHQAPLPPGIMTGPVIAVAGKIDPLRVAELIAHKVKIPAACRCKGDEADHLVEGHGPLDERIGVVFSHVIVHGGPGHAEKVGLIPHQGLVVGFGIADGRLPVAPVGQLVPDRVEIPGLIGHLLDELGPEIGEPHGKPIVKPGSPELPGKGQARHAAHIFGNGKGRGTDLVDQPVGKGKIDQRLLVHLVPIVVVIRRKAPAHAPVVVKHAGDSVKPEPVQTIRLQPVPAIGKQKPDHSLFPIIKTA